MTMRRLVWRTSTRAAGNVAQCPALRLEQRTAATSRPSSLSPSLGRPSGPPDQCASAYPAEAHRRDYMFALTDWNPLLTLLPTTFTTAMATAATSATMIPYSTIVAPDSSRTKRRIALRMLDIEIPYGEERLDWRATAHHDWDYGHNQRTYRARTSAESV